MFVKRFLQDERGTIESALVLVPLLILVLSVLQISMGVLARTVLSNQAQSAVAVDSMAPRQLPSSSPGATDPASGRSSFSEEFSLPGGGTLLIRHEQNDLPSLTPLLPRGDQFRSLGVSMNEGN